MVGDISTEQIRCILCNKRLDLWFQNDAELNICAECQAYFCPTCLEEIRGSETCPAARLLGVAEHKLRIVKILPPKLQSIESVLAEAIAAEPEAKTVKILPNKTVKIIEKDSPPEDDEE